LSVSSVPGGKTICAQVTSRAPDVTREKFGARCRPRNHHGDVWLYRAVRTRPQHRPSARPGSLERLPWGAANPRQTDRSRPALDQTTRSVGAPALPAADRDVWD